MKMIQILQSTLKLQFSCTAMEAVAKILLRGAVQCGEGKMCVGSGYYCTSPVYCVLDIAYVFVSAVAYSLTYVYTHCNLCHHVGR